MIDNFAARIAELREQEDAVMQESLDKDPDYKNAERIMVKSGYIGTRYEDSVAFSDNNVLHGPNGAFVFGTDEFEVAVTPEVLDALRNGRLVAVEEEQSVEQKMEEKVAEGENEDTAIESAKKESGRAIAGKVADKAAQKPRVAEGQRHPNPNTVEPGQTKGDV